MKQLTYLMACFIIILLSPPLLADDDRLLLETTIIKGNTELPKILYVVPWKSSDKNNRKQKIILHSLFGDLFDPVAPAQTLKITETGPQKG